jgi:hypothetical protein
MKPTLFSAPFREQRRPYGLRPPKNVKRAPATEPQPGTDARRALTAKFAHDPDALREITVVFSNDAELRAAITRDVAGYQVTIASLRAALEQDRKTIASLRAWLAGTAQRLQQLEFQRDQLRETAHHYKDAMRLNTTTLAIAKLDGERRAAQARIGRCQDYINTTTPHAERLAAALADVLLAPPAVRQETTLQPINVTPNINVEVKLPPAEVSVSLPARRTETTIERNRAGEIVRAEQIETDA